MTTGVKMNLERINLSIRDKATRCAVAKVYEGGLETGAYSTPQEATVIANILTAAPDLLAASQAALGELESEAHYYTERTGDPYSGDETIALLRAAIAKASGE